jgi:hypothetical protein
MGKDHFYTVNASEAVTTVLDDGYHIEGPACYLSSGTAGAVPFIRLWNGHTGNHFYTADQGEADNAVAHDGFVIEGPAGYIFPNQPPGTVPFFRLFNVTDSDHFYTTSAPERDDAEQIYAYRYESVAGYVYQDGSAADAELFLRLWNDPLETTTQRVLADLNADGTVLTVQGTDDNHTRVLSSDAVLWDNEGWIDGWNRRPWDGFLAADVDNDDHDEVVIWNNVSSWTGILKWQDNALTLLWGAPSPLSGPAGSWDRNPDDTFSLLGTGGQLGITITEPATRNGCVVVWDGTELQVVELVLTGTFTPTLMRVNANTFETDVPDGPTPPSGAVVTAVTNKTRDVKDGSAVQLSNVTHVGYAPSASLGGCDTPAATSHFFDGEAVAGSWTVEPVSVVLPNNVEVAFDWKLAR